MFLFLMLIYMSLATLKKKSRNNKRFAPISGRGINGFSLSGGHRNIGAVGQFRLISNTTRTPFRGVEPMGNGGSNGTYYNAPNNSGSCCTNDNKIIKKSSINNAGMLDTKYKWTKGTYPNFWVQEDDNSYRITRDQKTYIHKLSQKNGGCVVFNPQNDGKKQSNVSCDGNKKACSYYIGTKKYVRTPYAKNFNQPPITQGQYISSGGLFKNNCLPTPPNKQPFPMLLNHASSNYHSSSKSTKHISQDSNKIGAIATIGCNVNYLTWEEARDAGQLPDDWVPGYSESPPNYSHLVNRSSNYPNPNKGVTPNT